MLDLAATLSAATPDNCLKRAGVQTVGDPVRKSRAELSAIPNFGQKSIEEVIKTLHAHGPDLS